MTATPPSRAATSDTGTGRARPDASTTSTPPAAQPQRWTSRVALAGMVAPAGFFAVMMVLGLVTPGYDWVSRYGSELSIGPLGWIMIANFIALGVVELTLAAALAARSVTGRPGGWPRPRSVSSGPHSWWPGSA
jgi:hypothetical protein